MMLSKLGGMLNWTCHSNHSCKVGRSDLLSSPSRAIKMGGAQRVSSYIRLLQDSRGDAAILKRYCASEPLPNVHFDGLSVDTCNMGESRTLCKRFRSKIGETSRLTLNTDYKGIKNIIKTN